MWIPLTMTLAGAFGGPPAPAGWLTVTPRPEVSPVFDYESKAGPQGADVLVLRANERKGLIGHWERTFGVRGGEYHRFRVLRRARGIDHVRRAGTVRILWENDAGSRVLHDEVSRASYRRGERPRAEPEFPPDGRTIEGWTEIGGVHRAPSGATRARVQLCFRWGPPHSRIEYTLPTLERVDPPKPRRVRLATVHHRPKEGSTPAEKREQFGPLIAEAAAQRADLVVLPETLTYYGTKRTYAECAETVPGPSTKYFGKLAKQHDLYVVAGLLERDEHLVYNVAVLIGPDGDVVGKYRKVSLPRGEIEGGLAPGDAYPVFETRFGRVGMMVCYDGFFPEVARELRKGGAEVVAWPVWGCNPLLASARACENHVYVVSSTYTDPSSDWMLSAIWGHDGRVLAKAKTWRSVVTTEVDLAKPLHWHSLGDFGAQIERHRPPTPRDDNRDSREPGDR